MGYLYITRHGQTVWNVEGKVCGVTDAELTELGREQAAELIRELKMSKDINIDMVIASPLKRANDTAKIIADAI